MMEELYRLGVRTVCIAPGSRSTPLTLAVAEHEHLKTVVHFDERGMGYHALGIAKASNQPVAIICTSGGAVANLLPAVVEAFMSHVPLILLTADRPFELVDVGANQAIEQKGIFGNFVRYDVSLPCPDVGIAPNVLLSTVDHAYATATSTDSGPVHINCPFREPLTPHDDGTDVDAYCSGLRRWFNSEEPYTVKQRPNHNIQIDLRNVAHCKRGIVLVGRSNYSDIIELAQDCAHILSWPAIVDVGVKNSFSREQHFRHLVAYHDVLLLDHGLDLFDGIEAVIHCGRPMVSKRLQSLLESADLDHYISITTSHDRLDPGNLAAETYTLTPGATPAFEAYAREIDKEWRDQLVSASRKVGSFLAGMFAGDEITEPGVVRAMTQTECDALFLGNSMPIRDADMYGDPGGYVASVYVNRGASGIDGNIATVAGIARVTGQAAAILGDLAMLHDLNSLALLRDTNVNLVVVNNGGGGIFSMLPIAEQDAVFEKFFGTPHGYTFKSAAAQFDLPYYNPTTMTEFREVYEAEIGSGTSCIIEVHSDRAANAQFHKDLHHKLATFIDNGME